MRKTLFALPCMAAIALAAFVGMRTLERNKNINETLLMANVEALTEEEVLPSVKCGTNENYEWGVICPGHSHLIGFKGVVYSYNAVGYSDKYKRGRKGTTYSCPDLHQPTCPIDEVKEYTCPIK